MHLWMRFAHTASGHAGLVLDIQSEPSVRSLKHHPTLMIGSVHTESEPSCQTVDVLSRYRPVSA